MDLLALLRSARRHWLLISLCVVLPGVSEATYYYGQYRGDAPPAGGLEPATASAAPRRRFLGRLREGAPPDPFAQG